jgi:hypothetical protein
MPIVNGTKTWMSRSRAGSVTVSDFDGVHRAAGRADKTSIGQLLGADRDWLQSVATTAQPLGIASMQA